MSAKSVLVILSTKVLAHCLGQAIKLHEVKEVEESKYEEVIGRSGKPHVKYDGLIHMIGNSKSMTLNGYAFSCESKGSFDIKIEVDKALRLKRVCEALGEMPITMEVDDHNWRITLHHVLIA